MLFFVPDVPRGLLMQVWSAALNGRTSTEDRICCDRCRMFPCAIHTTNSHSQSTAYWQFLNRESRPHLPNSLFLRLRSGSLQPDRQLYFVDFHPKAAETRQC